MSGVQIFFLSVFIVWMAVSLFLTISWCIHKGLKLPCMPSEVFDYNIRNEILKEDKITSMPDERELRIHRVGSKITLIILILVNPIYVLLHSIWFIFNRNRCIEEYKWICYDNGYGGLIIVPVKLDCIEYDKELNCWLYNSHELKTRPFNRFVRLMKNIEGEKDECTTKDNN